jgi:hypothetical protein
MLWAPANPALNLEYVANQAKAQLKGIHNLIPHLKTLAGNVTKSVAHDYALGEFIERSDAKKN